MNKVIFTLILAGFLCACYTPPPRVAQPKPPKPLVTLEPLPGHVVQEPVTAQPRIIKPRPTPRQPVLKLARPRTPTAEITLGQVEVSNPAGE